MKALIGILASAALMAGLAKPVARPGNETFLVVGGDVHGYLAPCGCTEPMAGGIKRWATAVKNLRALGDTVAIVNGGLVAGTTRQDELKAESLAESYAAIGVAAVNLTLHDAQLGVGELTAVQRLSKGALTSLSVEPPESVETRPNIVAGPFLIGGIETKAVQMAGRLATTAKDNDVAIQGLLDEAAAQGKAAVLMVSGDEEAARTIARGHPGLAAIVFSATTIPRERPLSEGSTVLVTPGERGRAIVSLAWDGKAFGQYRVVTLGPDVSDDEATGRSFARYLDRVGSERLLMKLPRNSDAKYAGSKSCSACHEQAAQVWDKSAHAHAYETLVSKGHDKDPDCVGCHVTGLESTQGFQNRTATPEFASVGCESCHGPAVAHTMDPGGSHLKAVGQAACLTCHTTDNSPNFDFSTYWAKIRH